MAELYDERKRAWIASSAAQLCHGVGLGARNAFDAEMQALSGDDVFHALAAQLKMADTLPGLKPAAYARLERLYVRMYWGPTRARCTESVDAVAREFATTVAQARDDIHLDKHARRDEREAVLRDAVERTAFDARLSSL